LLQFTAGYLNDGQVSNLNKRLPAKRIFWSRFRSGFLCQNTHTIDLKPKPWYNRDILTPSHIGHLIKIAKIYWLYPFLLVSYSWLLFDILWSTKVKPDDESNQIIALCAVAGDWALKLYCWLHPNWTGPLYSYWSGWRDQREIAVAIDIYIKVRVK
jgi:hypothetical protein